MTRNAATISTLLFTIAASSLSAQAPAPRPPQTYSMFLQAQYAGLKRNIIGSAEMMPVEHFSFKPTPDVRTYAQLLGHIIDTQYFFCNAVKGGPNPGTGKDFEKITERAAMAQAAKEAFAYCDDAFSSLTDETAMQLITIGGAPNQRQSARANQLTMVIVHGNEHYGNLVTYMRIKGIVPPSSSPQ
jgi:uncharacterized damage-inducible protein DinB